MRSKKLLVALIATLVLLSTGCGSNFTSDEPETSEYETSESRISSKTSYSRFSCKEVEISGDNASWFFDFSYIITDNETGKQYLYLYHGNGHDGGAVMVELGTVDLIESNN